MAQWHNACVGGDFFKCLCHSSAEVSFLRRSLWTLRKLNFDAIILHYFASMTAPRAAFQFDKEWESQIKARSMYGGPFCFHCTCLSERSALEFRVRYWRHNVGMSYIGGEVLMTSGRKEGLVFNGALRLRVDTHRSKIYRGEKKDSLTRSSIFLSY